MRILKSAPLLVLLMIPAAGLCIVEVSVPEGFFSGLDTTLGNVNQRADVQPGRSSIYAPGGPLDQERSRDAQRMNRINRRVNEWLNRYGSHADVSDAVFRFSSLMAAVMTYQDLVSGTDELDSSGKCKVQNREGPSIPSFCFEDPRCRECFESARKDIDFARTWLEVLHVIACEKLYYAAKAIAFGDDVSPIHGMSGIAWQYEGRPQIEEAVSKLRNTYDRKYREYMKNLRNGLDKLDACEAEFGERGWYARFGYVYYAFMEDRYASPD